MGKMSRDKGARFEREVAKKLSRWRGVEFQRTPQSGGSRLAEGWALAGDLACPDPTFPFHVECKHVEGWDLLHLLTQPKGGLIGKWVDQAIAKCPADKIPLVVFKRNRVKPMVLIALTVEQCRQCFDLVGGDSGELVPWSFVQLAWCQRVGVVAPLGLVAEFSLRDLRP